LDAGDASLQHLGSIGISIGLEAGYNITSSVGIGTNLILSLPLSFSYDAFGDAFTHNSKDWDSFLGFDMLVGPIIVFNDIFKLLGGFHFDTYTLNASEKFSFWDTEKIKQPSVSSTLSYTSLGIGLSMQGKINLTPVFYGFINIHMGFDFFEIKRIDAEMTLSGSGSASWRGGTFNFELTPVAGIGLNY
jgi:hypothetical protein